MVGAVKGKEWRGRKEKEGRKGGEKEGKNVPWLLGSVVPGLMVGGRLELLGAYCVETAQFFFDHFRKMQYPLFGAVERGRVG